MRIIFVLCAVGLLQACATVSSSSRPDTYYRSQASQASQAVAIVGSDTENKNDQEIARLLNHQVKLPALNRIAIVNLNHNGLYAGHSAGINQLDAERLENFIGKLRSSEKIYDASFLPAMLTASDKNIDSLRFSAARMQADLLLAYQTLCGSFSDYNLFSDNKGRSYCTVEAVLLDVHSGIVAMTSVASETFDTQESKQDMNFVETLRRSEMKAANQALSNIATDIVKFIAEG